jgi:hypothetical protein
MKFTARTNLAETVNQVAARRAALPSGRCQVSNLEKLNRSFQCGRLLKRWRKIHLELFTPDLEPQRRQRIQAILDRIICRYNSLTPWKNNQIKLGGAR